AQHRLPLPPGVVVQLEQRRRDRLAQDAALVRQRPDEQVRRPLQEAVTVAGRLDLQKERLAAGRFVLGVPAAVGRLPGEGAEDRMRQGFGGSRHRAAPEGTRDLDDPSQPSVAELRAVYEYDRPRGSHSKVRAWAV